MMRFALILLLASLVALPAAAYLPQDRIIVLDKGTHKLLRQGQAVKRVAVGDPSVADVNVINRREVLVTGKTLGVTSLIVWDAATNTPSEYRITVRPVQDLSNPLPPDPALADARVQPGKAVTGSVNSLPAARAASAQAKAGEGPINTLQVNVDTQVMAAIKIVEVNRTTLQQYGFNFINNSLNTTVVVSPPGTLGSISNQGAGGFTLQSGSGFRAVQDAFQLAVGDASKSVLGVLSLLERQGLARTLAEPSLVAASGQTASFLAGGEFPIPVVQGNSNAVSIEFKEFGVRLNMTPTVLDADRINIKVAPEVSELDFTTGIQSGGVSVPSLVVRRTDTTVELGDGESFVISGLINDQLTSNVNKIPFLGDLPYIGAFFRSSRYSRAERELIMVVTPRIVRPFAAGAKLPPLPGAQYDDYRPGFDDTLLRETGEFDATGFSD